MSSDDSRKNENISLLIKGIAEYLSETCCVIATSADNDNNNSNTRNSRDLTVKEIENALHLSNFIPSSDDQRKEAFFWLKNTNIIPGIEIQETKVEIRIQYNDSSDNTTVSTSMENFLLNDNSGCYIEILNHDKNGQQMSLLVPASKVVQLKAFAETFQNVITDVDIIQIIHVDLLPFEERYDGISFQQFHKELKNLEK